MAGKALGKERAGEARDARVEAAHAVLADAVHKLRSSEDWTRFLSFQSHLYDYSAQNVLLITVQYQQLYEAGKVASPVPSYVASYRKWQELGRQVQRGQTGLGIIAPMRGMRREAVDVEGNTRRLGRGETPQGGETERRSPYMRGFTVEKVFAAEQTEGLPLPEAPQPTLLSGEAPAGLGEAVLRLIEERGFTVATVGSAADIGSANGVTSFRDKTVRMRADMDDAAMVRTLIHEATHVLMHSPGDDYNKWLSRSHREVEAESVAFIVARVHGMPADDYSFPYVATWAGENPQEVIANTAQRVASTAKDIIAISPAEHSHGGKAALHLTPPALTPAPAAQADAALIGT